MAPRTAEQLLAHVADTQRPARVRHLVHERLWSAGVDGGVHGQCQAPECDVVQPTGDDAVLTRRGPAEVDLGRAHSAAARATPGPRRQGVMPAVTGGVQPPHATRRESVATNARSIASTGVTPMPAEISTTGLSDRSSSVKTPRAAAACTRRSHPQVGMQPGTHEALLRSRLTAMR